MCTIVRLDTRAANSGVPRPSTASAASPSVTIKMTTSDRAKTAAVSGATSAPAASSARALASVRFHTSSGVSARSRFWAIGSPMTPSPMKPTECIVMNLLYR